ncbi:MAG TPA: phage integrase SAM-like domain-containing protein, partial [Steroidobacteraceae bacterium]|nr:phage integrase SAM-like domain-containing protein [Steroidobacteraceae bacterium]
MAEPVSEHQATIDWTRGKWSDAKGKYSREHTWHLAGGGKVKASDAGALLVQQQHVTPCTVTAYRDSFRLLLAFAHQRLQKKPSDIVLEDLNSSFILEFLNHLEVDRHNCSRSRNARFAAIRSFMEYVSFEEPLALGLAQSVLAIPMKRFEQPLVGFLSREHIEAILAAPDASTWTGQRDRVM